jgi:hypothetical protein
MQHHVVCIRSWAAESGKLLLLPLVLQQQGCEQQPCSQHLP